MNSMTLRGVFPEPKTVHRRNFLKENIRHLKNMQGGVGPSAQLLPQSTNKDRKSKLVVPNCRSSSEASRPKCAPTRYRSTGSSHLTATTRLMPQLKMPNKIVSVGIQTDAESPPRQSATPTKKQAPISPLSIGAARAHAIDSINMKMEKLGLEEKRDYIRANIRRVRQKLKKCNESDGIDHVGGDSSKCSKPTGLRLDKHMSDLTDANAKSTGRHNSCGGGDVSPTGLVLLPEEERKEYLKVARENYAHLIKELNAMPVRNDTLRKRKRKIEIEEELKKIEEVIKVFQKPKVFVKADG